MRYSIRSNRLNALIYLVIAVGAIAYVFLVTPSTFLELPQPFGLLLWAAAFIVLIIAAIVYMKFYHSNS